MNLYTIVTADEYELPVKCDVKAEEAATFLGVTNSYIRQFVFYGRARNGYRVIVSGEIVSDKKAYSRRYAMTHDRSEYFREYYRRKTRNGKQDAQRIQTQQPV